MSMHAPNDFYGRFIEPIEDRMIRAVWRITRDAQDAEDAMQSALLCVWERRHRIVRHAVPPALILKICADAACSVVRRRAKDRSRTQSGDPRGEPVDLAPSPWVEMVRRELTDEIFAAIGRLSRCQAVAVTLRLFDELPYEQIAAAMNCTEATARKHVQRARRRLQFGLAKYDPSRFTRSGS
jgi:RNA polymerase sigma-70 factor (ECF subfamily)